MPNRIYIVRTFDSSGKEGVSALVMSKAEAAKLKKYYLGNGKARVTVQSRRRIAIHGKKRMISLRHLP